MGIRWKWDGKTVELSNEEPATYADQQHVNNPFDDSFDETPEMQDARRRGEVILSAAGQATTSKEMEDLMGGSRSSALERMQQASPARKREWGYYMRHALRDLKKGGPGEDWLMGLYNSGGLNIDEDGYTWWKGLKDDDARMVDRALDDWLNRIGVWSRDETGKEQFNPYAIDRYQEDQYRKYADEWAKEHK